jgi:hypothetical protein
MHDCHFKSFLFFAMQYPWKDDDVSVAEQLLPKGDTCQCQVSKAVQYLWKNKDVSVQQLLPEVGFLGQCQLSKLQSLFKPLEVCQGRCEWGPLSSLLWADVSPLDARCCSHPSLSVNNDNDNNTINNNNNNIN